MKALALTAMLLSSFQALLAKEALPQLFMPDGQLFAHPVKVYVSSTNLDKGMDPRLQLVGFIASGRTNTADLPEHEPFLVVPDQTWIEMVENQSVSRTGTLLLFDLKRIQLPWYQSTIRLNPVLTWNPPGGRPGANASLVGKPTYLGRQLSAGFWTLVAMGFLMWLICWLCKRSVRQSARYLLAGDDDFLSLWRTQLAAWTLAVGSMVFCFGLIQLQVPKIPESLVALMGMSVATGGLSTIAARSKREPTGKSEKARTTGETEHDKHKKHEPQLSDLISSYNPEFDKVVLSVAKAQMVFWTGVILILFVVKSLFTGELWEVPWEMVTLTGVSQAGYVSDKALKRKPVSETLK